MKNKQQFWYDNHEQNKNGNPILNSIHIKSGDSMNIAVCDDEKVCLDLLSGYIKSCIATLDGNFCEATVETYFSGEQLLEAYSQGKQYDVLFLDIKMKTLSGFETAKALRELDSKVIIIFVTSLGEYIFNSFEFKPFWFIVKPVAEDKFRHILLKAITEVKGKKTGEYSFFSREIGLVNLDPHRILYLESILRRIIIHTTNQQYSCYASLTAEEQKLSRYDFIRIHKGFLVNMAQIQRINKVNVVLKNSVVLPLSEHRYKAVYDSFTSYLARCSV